MDWRTIISGPGYTIAFVAAAITFLLALWHFGKAVQHLKRPWHGHMLGPFILTMPSLYDEAGNRHRTLFLRYMGGAILAFVITFAIGYATA